MFKPSDLIKACSVDLTEINMKVITYWQSKDSAYRNTQPDITTARQDILQWTEKNLPITYSKLDENHKKRYSFAVLGMVKALQDGEIEKARYAELKDNFGGFIGHVVEDSEFRSQHGIDEGMNQDDISLLVYDRPSGLHEIASAFKKFTKAAAASGNPRIIKMLATLDELMLFNLVNTELKANIVTTRRTPSEQTLLNQGDMKTCSYCFRKIRLQNSKTSTIAYHGFKRYSWDIKSQSCSGSWHNSFEQDCSGSLQHLTEIKASIPNYQDKLKSVSRAISLCNRVNKIETDEYKQLVAQQSHLEYVLKNYFPDAQQLTLRMIKKHYPDFVAQAEALIYE